MWAPTQTPTKQTNKCTRLKHHQPENGVCLRAVEKNERADLFWQAEMQTHILKWCLVDESAKRDLPCHSQFFYHLFQSATTHACHSTPPGLTLFRCYHLFIFQPIQHQHTTNTLLMSLKLYSLHTDEIYFFLSIKMERRVRPIQPQRRKSITPYVIAFMEQRLCEWWSLYILAIPSKIRGVFAIKRIDIN